MEVVRHGQGDVSDRNGTEDLMNLHLRVLHGTLKRQDGADVGPDIAVRGKRFVIGSGPDCHMRCPSSSISEYHCEFVAEENGIFLRDLRSESGTILNGEPVTTRRQVSHGDHLRVGKLEFECLITSPGKPASQPAAAPEKKPAAASPAVTKPRKRDSIGDDISEMLAAADEQDRERSRHDPNALKFKPTEDEPAAAEPAQEQKKKFVRPPKQPPGKLPPKPKVVADSTVDAAEEVLKKIFDKPKK
jgi:predicted component of type VI protein secretion system